MDKPWVLHWFRRDLRVRGNAALREACDVAEGRVLGVFFFDSTFLSRADFSSNRFAFFLKTLRALQTKLRKQGGDLFVLDGGPRAGFEQIFAALKAQGRPLPKWVTFNRDYEPFARERDQAIGSWLKKEVGIEVRTRRDHLLIEPDELTKTAPGGGTYQVFTPFARRWLELLQTSKFKARLEGQGPTGKENELLFSLKWRNLLSSECLLDALDRFEKANQKNVTISIPDAGEEVAQRRVQEFQKQLNSYDQARDFPSLDGNSGFSIFFKNGSLTGAQVLASYGLFNQARKPSQFLKELIWREFYYHILFHHPNVEHESFLPQYRDLEWENRVDLFEAWKEGRTGYPIVDAGMRELNTTGRMHNRVRMIVASFLTKDLLIDWRWGERYFMEKLLDGDLAPNNGGWQWAASTGCDPQPYFRIFNPELQSRKFDPDGLYIKKFVPELKGLNSKEIHAPVGLFCPSSYPAPVVQHSVRKIKALALYGSARKKA